ncbi:MAG TPA: hypothetical protein VL175_07815 [Pirellulales bacterium]|jgi:magnesium-transporting ATPase (P-type)|nr:hypothetical protein [Pirellulales bacterium]
MPTHSASTYFSSSGGFRLELADVKDRAAFQPRPASVLFATFLIAVADICSPRTNLSVFYIVPLLMLADVRGLRYVGRAVGLFVVLTFAAYQIKKMMDPIGPSVSYFHFSLLNRVFVALMLIAVAYVMRLWVRWREEQSIEELPEGFRREDREISETLAVLCCVPLISLLGIVDYFLPANYNLAILYPIPLFIAVWTRNRVLLWALLAALLALAVFAQWAGPPATDPDAVSTMFRNRVMALFALVAVTVILHRWIGRERVAQ